MLHDTNSKSRITRTLDGCQAAAHVAYAYSEAAAIFPITPSSPMAQLCDEWAGNGRKNIYGEPLVISQMQSEAGAAAAVHGALLAGSLATTFTASQGLLLMLPNLYRMAGELLPGVIHVAARTIAAHALSIFGDHSDIYACRQTGIAIFSESSVQEVMDLSPVPHLAAVKGRIPFLNFFDGFRTSHELQKIRVWSYEDLREMLDMEAVVRFRNGCLHPHHGKVYGSAQNPDIFFQAREASNSFYLALPRIVEEQLEQINRRLGTSYGLFDYYGAPDAEHVIIAMGSICETIKEYIDSVPGEKIGLINVHLYRPFSSAHLAEKLPGSVRRISVLDRTREPGSVGEPLFLDVVAALTVCGIPLSGVWGKTADAGISGRPETPGAVFVCSGRYGLSSKDTTPAQIAAVYANHTKQRFTVGITDDVTHLSLEIPAIRETASEDVVSCKFWGLGGDGTVSATKNTVKIIGDHTDRTAQGYFEYDSKKSRGLTVSHLRFGKKPIRSAYLIRKADLVACHNPVYLHKYDMVQEIKDGGIFLLNFHPEERDCTDKEADGDCPVSDPAKTGSDRAAGCSGPDAHSTAGHSGADSHWAAGHSGADGASLEPELNRYLPLSVKQYLKEHHIRLFVIDALGIGKEIGLNNKISTILQAAFFSVSNLLEPEEAKHLMIEAAEKSYGKSGGKILEMNRIAIERGFSEVREVHLPQTAMGTDTLDNALLPDRPEMMDFVRNIQQPVTDQRGDSLPVSAFLPYADGYTPPGSSAHERRAVATELPVWKPENCIQCNRCSFVCPHAVIRPAVLNPQALAEAPEALVSIPMMGMDNCHFAVTVSSADCTGCGTCAAVCPGRQQPGMEKPAKALEMVPVNRLLAGGQFRKNQEIFDYCKPLLPCREAAEKFRPATPKGSQFLRPALEFSGACAGCGETPYVKLLTQLFGDRMYIANATGCSSIWANSSPSCAYALDEKGHGPAWSNSLFEDAAEFGYGMLMAREAAARRDPETSPADTVQWVIGGDGWAYDIGFSGLDHILASGKNINILVLNTEVYSNTGGQASKATPLGSTAKFVSGGKKTPKKDLAAMAMTYGTVYVAQIAMGADFNQTVQAITEAAAYPGPSLIIAYATCIAHGIRAGLGSTPHEAKKAVDAGYYHLFRFNPSMKEQGKNPFHLDSREPQLDYETFLDGEIRYDALKRYHPEQAQALFRKAAAQAGERYRYLKKLEMLYSPE